MYINVVKAVNVESIEFGGAYLRLRRRPCVRKQTCGGLIISPKKYSISTHEETRVIDGEDKRVATTHSSATYGV